MLQPTNVTSMLIAAIAAWIFGAIYYTVFSKAWIAARGETMESMKAKMAGKSGLAKAAPFIISFIAEILMAGAGPVANNRAKAAAAIIRRMAFLRWLRPEPYLSGWRGLPRSNLRGRPKCKFQQPCRCVIPCRIMPGTSR